MKRLIPLLVLVLMVAALVLSACGGAPAAAPADDAAAGEAADAAAEPAAEAAAEGEPVELVFWSMWNEGENQALALQEIFAKFEEANPNITVNVTWNGRQNQTMLRNALAAGTKVDLMDQDADQVAGGMVSAGMGYDLAALLDSTALDEDVPLRDVFVPGVLNMFDVDGKTYLLPYIYNTSQFFYNKDIFAEAGVGEITTWEQLISECKKITDAGFNGIAIEGPEPGYNSMYFTYLLARLKGPGWMTEAANDKTGEMWNDPAVLQAAQMSRELWESGCIPEVSAGYKWPQAQQTIAAGETAMELVGSWLPTELLPATGPDFNWGALNFPAIEGGEGQVTDLQAFILSFMILKDSAHPAEAGELLKFIVTQESQELMVEKGVVGVTRKGVQWPANIAEAQAAAESATAVFGEGDGLQGSNAEFWTKVLRDPFSNMFVGQITPEEFVENLVTDSAAFWANQQ
ncbi:MAG: ABC transporter substrate-binding protein [Caldilineaceae bacterium]